MMVNTAVFIANARIEKLDVVAIVGKDLNGNTVVDKVFYPLIFRRHWWPYQWLPETRHDVLHRRFEWKTK